MASNALWYGDNLDVLREHVPPESVDLIYLDPPFNSNRSYNVLFGRKHGDDAHAQIEAFDDTWTWTPATEQLYLEMLSGGAPARVADALQAMHGLVGEGEVMAYLAMMAARLVELHRVLRPTGSIYLHCDPTASHYLKVLMDAIFDVRNYRSEITWRRTTTHGDSKKWANVADILLYYGKSQTVTWNPAYEAYSEEYLASKYRHDDHDGRGPYRLDNMTSPNPRPNLTYEWMGHAPPAYGWRYDKATMQRLHDEGRIWYPDQKAKRPQLKRYLNEMSGPVMGNVWTDIPPINSQAAERLGYPTQKPQALLERIVGASSNEGDVVLDPFCGCGTTIAAAQALGRRWIGIDVTFLAIDLVRRRLEDAYLNHTDGPALDYELHGIPRDLAGAKALFQESPFDFERWAVSMVQGQPNEKQVGDKGIDGVIRFPLDSKSAIGRCIVSVKGGGTVNPAMVQALNGAVDQHKAEMGVLIVMDKITKGMTEAANHSGTYAWPVNGGAFPRIQVVSVADLLQGKPPKLPPVLTPYLKASRHKVVAEQLSLG